MTNREQFNWVWTALITPFNKEWWIDWESIDRLIEKQIDGWVKGILFLWTTWENPTIGHNEWIQIVERWIQKINERCKVMVNIGTYSTYKSVKRIQDFEKIWKIDAFLAVNPYYNKPTQKWLYMHFQMIADSTSLPLFLYNITSRTGVNLETETLVKLSKNCKNIVWVKEASGNMEQMKEVIANTHDDFIVLSWDDSFTLELIQNWWNGVVSVASNFLTEEVVYMVQAALNEEVDKAKKADIYLQDFFEQQFIQTNPLPIKTALAHMWLIEEQFRLPMCTMDPEPRKKWLELVEKYTQKNW